MIGKTLNYISHHAIAILALVCSLLALAGASYAATQMPKNSVGNAQIKQGAVAPPKLSKQIGGYVRMYAVVNANGKLQYSSPQAKLTELGRLTARAAPASGRSPGSRPSRRTVRGASRLPRPAFAPTSRQARPSFRIAHGVTGTHVSVGLSR